MPELPEVETIRNGLSRFILSKKIEKIEILDSKLFLLGSNEFLSFIGDEIVSIDRLGKAMLFSFKNNSKKLIVHLKMTGQLIYFSKNEQALIAGGHSEEKEQIFKQNSLKHLRLKILFKDGSALLFNDVRKFGYFKLVDDKELDIFKARLGLEPFSNSFQLETFLSLFKNRKKNVKAFLLDQSLILGIGNIYADEILFESRISPFRLVSDLSLKEKKGLFINIKKILQLAVDNKGTTFNNYLDASGNKGNFLSLLKVYGRKGEPCLVCKKSISKDKLAGRGTHYCLKCQK